MPIQMKWQEKGGGNIDGTFGTFTRDTPVINIKYYRWLTKNRKVRIHI